MKILVAVVLYTAVNGSDFAAIPDSFALTEDIPSDIQAAVIMDSTRQTIAESAQEQSVNFSPSALDSDDDQPPTFSQTCDRTYSGCKDYGNQDVSSPVEIKTSGNTKKFQFTVGRPVHQSTLLDYSSLITPGPSLNRLRKQAVTQNKHESWLDDEHKSSQVTNGYIEPERPLPPNQCPNGISLRKSWNELYESEKALYIEAVQCLMSTPSTRKPYKGSVYDDFVYQHWETARKYHFTPAFLAFHRAFLVAFERALQSCGNEEKFRNVHMIYWDVAMDAMHYAEADVFRDEYFGGNGNQDQDSCVESGAFAYRTCVYPKDHCLRRAFKSKHFYEKGNSETTLGVHFSDAEIEYESKHNRKRTFDYFRNYLESTVHEAVHFGVGGHNGDMSKASTAPNDPILYLHHSNIDRIWSDWQASLPDLRHDYDGTDEHGRNVSLDDEILLGSLKDLLPFDWDKQILRVRDMFDASQWCYTYSPGLRHDDHGVLVENMDEYGKPGMSRFEQGRRSSSLTDHFIHTGQHRFGETGGHIYHFDQEDSKNTFFKDG